MEAEGQEVAGGQGKKMGGRGMNERETFHQKPGKLELGSKISEQFKQKDTPRRVKTTLTRSQHWGDESTRPPADGGLSAGLLFNVAFIE